MNNYGVIGYPLAHSFSPEYFKQKFLKENIAATYAAFPIEDLNQIRSLVNEKNLSGFNVTIPYKEKIISLLDSLSDEAKEIGAVNCVKVENEKLTGFNTDAYGFQIVLNEVMKSKHENGLVLGLGGAARAVKYVLKKSGINFTSVVRDKSKGDLLWNELTEKIISENPLIINCTPLGMFPNEKSFPPIPYSAITEKHLLFDLVYNPAETLFMKNGKEKEATVSNGLRMFELQADKSWEIWNK
ncbi:shikimate 5-dehydrogenase [Bacteroidota bacterium]|nr:shikimate 5-dehydrogenase [Bacteroidota bacterium]